MCAGREERSWKRPVSMTRLHLQGHARTREMHCSDHRRGTLIHSSPSLTRLTKTRLTIQTSHVVGSLHSHPLHPPTNQPLQWRGTIIVSSGEQRGAIRLCTLLLLPPHPARYSDTDAPPHARSRTQACQHCSLSAVHGQQQLRQSSSGLAMGRRRSPQLHYASSLDLGRMGCNPLSPRRHARLPVHRQWQ